MLLSLKDFLKERGMASLQELSLHFCKEPKIIHCMLEHWIRKGKICRLKRPSGCTATKCQLCSFQSSEIYQWVGDSYY